ncbi:T9SS type A sorting domain-containing protein [Aureispira anguillae]|uniref:T9SS type A sorting domain-containing protein n=1 Tax=Aureispira anguillae TaxID=2864201 RepID=A0A915YGJ2_9BACT|nr:T9SS type A sorting domain-containing protein [Aureispira anguillae]BDS12637.1 T9SS type A sorting domain-containing protein [Aureispira anguillae]
MKSILLFFSILLSSNLIGQAIITNKGATIHINTDAILAINGDLHNESTGVWSMKSGSRLQLNGSILNNALNHLTADTGGTVILKGNNLRNLSGQHPIRFYHLELDLTAANVQLDTTVQIDGNVQMTSGNIDLNGQNINLSPNSSLINETNAHRIFGNSGLLRISRTINSPNSLNIGGLGLVVTSTSNWGNTTIERGHQQHTDQNGNLSILRYYNLAPTHAIGSTVHLEFHYLDHEIVGQNEANLQLWRSIDNGNTWTKPGGSIHVNSNHLTYGGLDSSQVRLTLGPSSSILPIQALNFNAQLVEPQKVRLDWSTVTEIGCDYFEVQRSNNGLEFQSLGIAKGAGTTYDRQNYSRWDLAPFAGHNYYRLKQVFFDGTIDFSPIRHLYIQAINQIVTVYPNPIVLPQKLQLKTAQEGNYQFTLYNALGEIVFSKQWYNSNPKSVLNCALPELSAANYFYTVQCNQSLKTQGKLVLLH